MLGASVPLISRKSYLSSKRKSLKTRAIVSPGSARMDHVQSRLLSYSAGYPGLVIEPAVPLSVPPHAPSAEETRKKKTYYLLIYLFNIISSCLCRLPWFDLFRLLFFINSEVFIFFFFLVWPFYFWCAWNSSSFYASYQPCQISCLLIIFFTQTSCFSCQSNMVLSLMCRLLLSLSADSFVHTVMILQPGRRVLPKTTGTCDKKKKLK